jgi:predicted TPR repeat methyltransferase
MRAAESPREDVRFAAWSLLGALHAEHGALEASAEAFGRAVEARPDDFDTRMLHAEALERIGALPQALAEVQEALRLRPSDEEAARVRDLLSGEIGAGRVPRGD